MYLAFLVKIHEKTIKKLIKVLMHHKLIYGLCLKKTTEILAKRTVVLKQLVHISKLILILFIIIISFITVIIIIIIIVKKKI